MNFSFYFHSLLSLFFPYKHATKSGSIYLKHLFIFGCYYLGGKKFSESICLGDINKLGNEYPDVNI